MVEVEQIDLAMTRRLARRQGRGVLVRVIGTRRFPTDISPVFELAALQDWPGLLASIGHGDVTTRDPLGNTVLHYAASWGHLPTVVALASAGVPIGYRNQQRFTAEELARERGHDDIATYLACRERQVIPLSRSSGLARRRHVDGRRLLLGGRVRSAMVPLDAVTGLALSGPWRRSRSLLLAVAHPDGRSTPTDDDFSRHDLEALGGPTTVVRVPTAAPHLLWQLLPVLIERRIPVGTMAHRWAALEGWDDRRAAALGQPSDRFTVEPVDAVAVGAPIRGLAILPSGFFVVRSGDGGGTESLVPWSTLLHLARRHAHDDPQIELQMDQTFPWVEQIAGEVRATGIAGAHPVDTVAEPPLPHGGTALHAHLWSGRNDLAIDLIGTGFDVHRPDRFGRTPLHIAAGLGAIAVADELIAHGADPEARDDAGRRPRTRSGS